MRTSLFSLALAGVFAILLVLISAYLANKTEAPIPTTARLLDHEPDYYAGRIVSLKTDGFEPTVTSTEFIYRPRTDKPPIVLIRFLKPPDRLPPVITGRCLGRQITTVLVVDCR